MWQIVKWAGIPMSATIYILTLVALGKEAETWGLPAWGWLLVAYLVFAGSALSIILGLRKENNKLKHREGLVFYPHRPDLETLKKFIREHEVIYAFFPMGDSVKINHLFDKYKGKFQHIILMDTEGKHIQSLPERYYVNDSVGLKKGINDVANAIKANNTDLKLWDGCFPFSLFIGNPLSQTNNGSILLEVHIPFTAGSDRPAVVFKQKDYPELFKRIQNAYDAILKLSR